MLWISQNSGSWVTLDFTPRQFIRGRTCWEAVWEGRKYRWRCSSAHISKFNLIMSQKMSFLRKFMNYTFMKSKRNFRNIVIIGHNYSLLFVDFVCISMGSLFSGVLPLKTMYRPWIVYFWAIKFENSSQKSVCLWRTDFSWLI